jgi:Domain of unknown function (DUF4386)
MIAVTAAFLILVPIAFNATFFLLQRMFDYPDILRRPTDEILRRFRDGGPNLRLAWYGFALSALLFTPVPVLVLQVFDGSAPWYLPVATVVGVLAAFAQTLGLMRWPFLVTDLAATYADPKSSPATRDAVAVTFQAFHRNIGVAVGEHLGYIFTAVWSLLLSIAILQTGVFHPVFGWVGIVAALGVFAGVFEETGFKLAGLINALSYVLWSLWLIALGAALLFW